MGYTYIKLFRKIMDWCWYKDSNTKAVFLHLLLNANITDKPYRNDLIRRGEMVTSFRHLAKDLNLSERAVRTAVEHLEKTGEVTHRSTRNYTVFSVVNFDPYQGERHTRDTENDTPEARQATHRRGKKNQAVSMDAEIPSSGNDTVNEGKPTHRMTSPKESIKKDIFSLRLEDAVQ